MGMNRVCFFLSRALYSEGDRSLTSRLEFRSVARGVLAGDGLGRRVIFRLGRRWGGGGGSVICVVSYR